MGLWGLYLISPSRSSATLARDPRGRDEAPVASGIHADGAERRVRPLELDLEDAFELRRKLGSRLRGQRPSALAGAVGGLVFS